jgi:general secretion pathway protein I
MSTVRGFTLLEVLVALAVISLTMLAVLGTAARSSDAAAQVAERTLATWVADNELTRFRLDGGFPEPGQREGRVTLGDRDWRWTLTIVNTEDADLRRLEVIVRPADAEHAAATLVGFVPRTRSAAVAPLP